MPDEKKDKEDAQKRRAEEGKKEAPQEQKLPDSVIEARDISIALDGYDDIFSDFDPRKYSEREISSDFLRELETRHMEGAGGKLELRFYLPKDRRNEKTEEHIIRRLQNYFKLKIKELSKEDEKRRREGLGFMALGLGVLLVQIYLAETSVLPVLAPILEVMLVPFGWFAAWVGLERLFERGKETSTELELANRLSRAQYLFISEEENIPKESWLSEARKPQA